MDLLVATGERMRCDPSGVMAEAYEAMADVGDLDRQFALSEYQIGLVLGAFGFSMAITHIPAGLRAELAHDHAAVAGLPALRHALPHEGAHRPLGDAVATTTAGQDAGQAGHQRTPRTICCSGGTS